MKNNYFIIHGSFSSPFSNWIPYLRNEISNRNLDVYTPDLPSGVGYQNYTNWEKIMLEYYNCGLINENTIIYAHSIAPVFICKFLVMNKIKIKRLISICGFNNYFGINNEYDTVNETMYFDNLKEVKNYCSDIICYYSDNDPYVEYNTEKDYADNLTNKQNLIEKGGHLNAESGYSEFEDLLKWL